jgi:hypothetical protein
MRSFGMATSAAGLGFLAFALAACTHVPLLIAGMDAEDIQRVSNDDLCRSSDVFLQTRGRRFPNIENEIDRRGLPCGDNEDVQVAEQESPVAPVPAPVAAPAAETASRALQNANMRSGPGAGHAVVGSLRVGETVTVLRVVNGWCECMAGGRRVFISCRLLTAPAGGWAALSGSGGTGVPAQGAERFLRELYARMEREVVPPYDWASLLAPDTRAAWLRAYNDDGSHQYNYNPLCSCVDLSGLEIKSVQVGSLQNGRLFAEIRFDLATPRPWSPYIVRFELVVVGSQWRIYDARHLQGAGSSSESIRQRLGLPINRWVAPTAVSARETNAPPQSSRVAQMRAQSRVVTGRGTPDAIDISSPVRFLGGSTQVCSFSPVLDRVMAQLSSDDRRQVRRSIEFQGMTLRPIVRETGTPNRDNHIIQGEVRLSRPITWNGLTVKTIFGSHGYEVWGYGLRFAESAQIVHNTLRRLGLDIPLNGEVQVSSDWNTTMGIDRMLGETRLGCYGGA